MDDNRWWREGQPQFEAGEEGRWQRFEEECRLSIGLHPPQYLFSAVLFRLYTLWPWARVVSAAWTCVGSLPAAADELDVSDRAGAHFLASSLIARPIEGGDSQAFNVGFTQTSVLRDLREVYRTAPWFKVKESGYQTCQWACACPLLAGQGNWNCEAGWCTAEVRDMLLTSAKVTDGSTIGPWDPADYCKALRVPVREELGAEPNFGQNPAAHFFVRIPVAITDAAGRENVLVMLDSFLVDLRPDNRPTLTEMALGNDARRLQRVLQDKLIDKYEIKERSGRQLVGRLTPARLGHRPLHPALDPGLEAARLAAPKWPQFQQVWLFTDAQRKHIAERLKLPAGECGDNPLVSKKSAPEAARPTPSEDATWVNRLAPPQFEALRVTLDRQFPRLLPRYRARHNDERGFGAEPHEGLLTLVFLPLVAPSGSTRETVFREGKARWLQIANGREERERDFVAEIGARLESIPVGAAAVARVAQSGLAEFMQYPALDPDYAKAKSGLIPLQYDERVVQAETLLFNGLDIRTDCCIGLPLFLPELPRCFGVLMAFLKEVELREQPDFLAEIANRLHVRRPDTENILGQSYLDDVYGAFTRQAFALFRDVKGSTDDLHCVNRIAAQMTLWLVWHTNLPLIAIWVEPKTQQRTGVPARHALLLADESVGDLVPDDVKGLYDYCLKTTATKFENEVPGWDSVGDRTIERTELDGAPFRVVVCQESDHGKLAPPSYRRRTSAAFADALRGAREAERKARIEVLANFSDATHALKAPFGAIQSALNRGRASWPEMAPRLSAVIRYHSGFVKLPGIINKWSQGLVSPCVARVAAIGGRSPLLSRSTLEDLAWIAHQFVCDASSEAPDAEAVEHAHARLANGDLLGGLSLADGYALADAATLVSIDHSDDRSIAFIAWTEEVLVNALKNDNGGRYKLGLEECVDHAGRASLRFWVENEPLKTFSSTAEIREKSKQQGRIGLRLVVWLPEVLGWTFYACPCSPEPGGKARQRIGFEAPLG